MQVFFSYGHDHTVPLVDYLRRVLESDNHTVWIDTFDIKSGDDWRRSIINGILGSKAAFSFASAYSVRVPGVCLNELSIAVGVKGAWVQSILLEPGVTPHKNVRFKQSFDMSDWLDHVKNPDFLRWYLPWREKLASSEGSKRSAVFKEFDGDIVSKLLAADEAFLLWFGPIAEQIKDQLRDPLTERYAEEVRELREAMMPDELNYKQRALEEEAYSGRAWLKESMDAWMEDALAPRTLLITGGPGVGKSSFVAHELLFNEHVGAAIYCEWDNPASNNPDRVARSIAFQLACRYNDYRALLINILHRERAQGEGEISSLAGTAFERYVVEPIKTSIDNSLSIIILVDAIDEVQTEARERGLPELISTYAKLLPSWVRFVVTCRNNSSCLEYMREARWLSIDELAPENLDDIREFIALRLRAKQDDPVVEKVLGASNGVFLNASLLCDELEHEWITVDQVSKVPQSLGQVYRRYFERMFSDASGHGYEGQPVIGCKEALSALSLGLGSMPRRTLGCASCWDEPQTTSFLERCGHFLMVVNDSVSFSHKSIPDWLRSPDAHEYQTSDAAGWKALAVACYTQYDNGIAQMNEFELKYLVRCLQEARRLSPAFSQERSQYSIALDQVLSDKRLGQVLIASGNDSLGRCLYDLAEQYANDAILVFGNLARTDERGCATSDIVCGLGESYLLLCSALDLSVQLENAVKCCEEGMRVLKECREKADDAEAMVWGLLGKLQLKKAYVLYRIGYDASEIQEEFEGAHQSFLEAHDSYGAAEVIVLLGKAYRLSGKHRKAVECAERLECTLDLDACRTDNPEYYCYVRINQGDFYISAREYAKAKACLDDALAASSESSTKLPIAWAAQLNLQLSQLWYRMADYERGEGYAKKALELEREAYGNVSVEACNGLNQLGNCLLRQGRYEEALAYFLQSYSIRRRLYGEINRFTAISLRNCAAVHREMGGAYLAQAEEEYRHVLAIHEELFTTKGGSLTHVAETQFDLANVCLRSSRFAEALEYAQGAGKDYMTALGSVEEDKVSFALCYQAEGEALIGLGREVEGREILLQALRLFEEAYVENQDHPNIVRLRELLASKA